MNATPETNDGFFPLKIFRNNVRVSSVCFCRTQLEEIRFLSALARLCFGSGLARYLGWDSQECSSISGWLHRCYWALHKGFVLTMPWVPALYFCLEDLLPLRRFVLAVLQVSSQDLSDSSCLVLTVSSAFKY